ncbi:GDSL family lipase [Rhodoferax koreense]|uniref:GDSL family lipase n=1 Tax=Rhodoferax koreensis TaxID=1842727 RepID=A0A1P8K2I8_9BURK|nr:SGNH/GDSL hydrolase family protein [Rhodoferax koreense]APW40222.1 GDSL family lipase [Rhodoferax koreense]
MTLFSLRRAILVAACASAALLTACGSGSTENALSPSRFVVFGDGFSDVGQTGAVYSVNDGSVDTWPQQMAARFGLTIAPSSSGGTGYARVNARVTNKPDAAGVSTTLTMTEQIDSFLASNTIGGSDVMVLSAGVADVVAQMNAVTAGSQTEAQMTANLQQTGKDLGAQVRRLVNAGAKQVIVVGPYNVGRSPWATAINRVSLLTDVSNKFNDALLVSIVDLGSNVLYVDAAYYLNLVTGEPTSYSLINSSTVVCNSVDAGVGIGTGTGQINSALCNTGTVGALAYNSYVFADQLFFTPVVNRLFGDYAYSKVRDRF